MRNRGKLCSIALASTFLIFVLLILLSNAVSAAQAGVETKIVPEQRLVVSTATYGNLVTWYETSANTPHVYDLSIGKELDDVYGGVFSNMEVYESKVVWDNGFGVALYDTSTKELTQIANGACLPDIYGDKIVYERNEPYTECTLYLYDLKTKNETKIIDGNDADYKLAIYGNKIIWVSPNSPSTIYIYDIPSKKVSTTNSSDVVNGLDIYENTIVWQSGNDIYMRDISTHKTTQITTSRSASGPKIYGNRIVYISAGDVYMYEISTAKTTRITNSACAYAPSIYNDKIVYADYRNDPDLHEDTDIYLYNLSAETIKPSAAFTTNAISGTPPLFVLFTATGNGGTPTSWNWSFGDGTYSSHAETATHTFTRPGNYTVNLTVSNDAGSDTVIKEGYITVIGKEKSVADPVADFYSLEVEEAVRRLSDHGIYENDAVSFFDNSTGTPTSWFWDFGDGNTSTEQNPTHVYGKMGGYTVNLTVENAAGNDTISKYGYVSVVTWGEPATPAYFSADVTSGNAPLTVTFRDDEENSPIYREWDFGEGTTQLYWVGGNESATPYVTHVYEKPGKYTVTFSRYSGVGFSRITKYHYITVTDPDVLIADFSSNVSEGYVPLTVQFNDSSQNATSRVWDFNNDGQTDSEEMNPVHTYTEPGTYIVNLTVSNENGTSTKTATITVLKKTTSSSSSSGSGNSGGSGSASGSPEPAKNVKSKELSQVFITSGKAMKFEFPQNATAIAYLSFDSKKTVGKTTTIVEMLKNKSTLTPDAPTDEVYNYLNIWVGNGGYGSDEDNLENAVACFRVEKAWIQDKGIDKSSIILNRYNDKKWNELPTTLLSEDDKYLYFTAETPGFSPFAITGEATAKETEIQPETGDSKENTGNTAADVEQQPTSEENTTTPEKESNSTPGFEMIYGVAGLLAVFLHKRK